jgi:hypothetical protein
MARLLRGKIPTRKNKSMRMARVENFRYINTVRRPDGTLRTWDEHNAIANYERECDRAVYEGGFAFRATNTLLIKDIENEK